MPGAPGYIPGAPMFYAPPGGFMAQGQRPVFPPNGMMPRGPRWAPQPQQGQQIPVPGFPQGPQGFSPNNVQGRPPRQPRPARGGAANQTGGRAQAAGQRKSSSQGRSGANAAVTNGTTQQEEQQANGTGALTAAALAAVPPEMQKQMIGERLYPLM